eukprot:Em0009g862a
MKRSASHVEIEPEPEGEVEVKRKVVSLKTFQKWRTEMDRDLKTISWLSSSEAIENGKKIVKELKCSVCAKFRIQIMSRRNFSDYWITGASSIRTSNIRDHAKSDQHLHAMSLFQRERFASNGPSSSTAAAPIFVALTTLQDDERARLRKKMDVAYFVAKEKMSFHPDTEHYLYQSQELKNFTAATLYYTNHAADICERVVQCMRTRLAWTELQLLRDIIFILATEISMTQFDADPAIKLWWNDKVRRPVRKVKVPGSAEELDESDDSSSSSDSEDNSMHLLSDWDSIVQLVKGADRAHSKVSSIKNAIEVLVPSVSITVSRSGGVNTC